MIETVNTIDHNLLLLLLNILQQDIVAVRVNILQKPGFIIATQ